MSPPTKQPTLRRGRHYTADHIDPDTGEITSLSLGYFYTLTAFGQQHGLGCRKIRRVLHAMGLLQLESFNSGRFHRYRLTTKAVKSGFGIRHDKCRIPFDVLSPAGQAYAAERLIATITSMEKVVPTNDPTIAAALASYEAQRSTAHPCTVQAQIIWLAKHAPYATPVDISRATGIAGNKVRAYLSRHRRSQTVISATIVRGAA